MNISYLGCSISLPTVGHATGLASAGIKWITGGQEALSRALKTASLTFQFVNAKLGERGSAEISSLNQHISDIKKFRTVLGFFALHSLWGDVREAADDLAGKKTCEAPGVHKMACMKVVETLSEAVSATAGSAQTIFSRFSKTAALCKPLKVVGDYTAPVSEMTAAVRNSINLKRIHSIIGKTDASTDAALINALKEDRTTHLLKSISKIAASTKPFFAVTAVCFGVGAGCLAGSTGIGVALLGASAGMAAKVWETSLDRKTINIWKPI
jgi:hypothetical protein